MRILIAHNTYRHPGGEDSVFRTEVNLLRAHGHEVFTFERHNRDVPNGNRISTALGTIWNRDAYRAVAHVVKQERIELVHFHNTLPLISPAAYWAARSQGAAVVQTFHNYRFLCPNGMLFRLGNPCDLCAKRLLPLPGIWFGCYRGNRLATATVGATSLTHRLLGTWSTQVDRYIVLTQFARKLFAQAGIPEEQIVVKPNFVADQPLSPRRSPPSGFLFVGRLSPEKGINTLLAAVEQCNSPVVVVGDGPVELTSDRTTLIAKGRQSGQQVRGLMGQATALLFPSTCYEGFPIVIAEAYASGLPVIASRIGGIPEIVEDGVTGLLVTPGDHVELAAKIRWAQTHLDAMSKMGLEARKRYVDIYSPGRNYTLLMSIYRDALARRQSTGPGYGLSVNESHHSKNG
ncbi:hypothetical protein CKO25_11635 [Thiocapsa imhoffii]|uniref:Glycosyltransferase subfamily 4-like N-terminal domain-containing protein n=2 Tax=Thiocapsa imhoffii TaxID=382777 RepID=A0A9X0WIN1_9GAMM|nr:hypothetical protein [Thiocapsa imhoffii]